MPPSKFPTSFHITHNLPNRRWCAEISRWQASLLSKIVVTFCWRLFAPLTLLASRRLWACLCILGCPRPWGDSAEFCCAAPEGRGRDGPCTPLGGDKGGHLALLRCRSSWYPEALGPMCRRRRQGRIFLSTVALSRTSRGLCASLYTPLLCARGRRT